MNRIKNLIGKFLIITALIFTNVYSQSVELLTNANEAYNNKDYKETITLFKKVINNNPYNGEFYYKLGSSYYYLEMYESSSEAYKKSLEIGYRISSMAYNIACNYSLQNKTDEALEWLQISIKNGLRNRERLINSDSDLDNIRSNEEFIKLYQPKKLENISRVDAWKTDISIFKNKFEQTHYRLFDNISKSDWENSFKELLNNFKHKKDYNIIVELMKIATSSGAGHSYVIPPFSGKHQFHQLPIELYEFTDGIFIRKVKKGYEHLLGLKVKSINNFLIEDIQKRLLLVANPENKITQKWTSLFYATLPEVLESFGIINELNVVQLTVIKSDGSELITDITSELFTPQILASKGTPKGWVSWNDNKDSKPTYLLNANKKFWMKFNDQKNYIYCQVNEIRNDRNESLAEFGKSLNNLIDSTNSKALVLDLRLNNGGNGMLNRDFLVELIKSKTNVRGKFFTIIGRKTFSAAMLLATQLDQYTETIFIGEPTGGKPSHVGDDNQFILPYSGLMASAAMSYWQSHVPYDDRNWIGPKINIQLSSKDYQNNADPVLEYIETILK